MPSKASLATFPQSTFSADSQHLASSPDVAQRNPGATQTETVLLMWLSIDIIMTLDWN